VTPRSSLISFVRKITIDRPCTRFNHAQPPIKTLISR
jgi:hypothetical protein